MKSAEETLDQSTQSQAKKVKRRPPSGVDYYSELKGLGATRHNGSRKVQRLQEERKVPKASKRSLKLGMQFEI